MLKKSVAALLAVLFFITLGAVAFAQSVPALPALCYGELRVNGNPAPLGTLVVAKVDGVNKGELVSEEAGWYGGPGLASKLAVTHEGSTGKMVKFYMSGSYSGMQFTDAYAGEVLYWGSGEVKQVARLSRIHIISHRFRNLRQGNSEFFQSSVYRHNILLPIIFGSDR